MKSITMITVSETHKDGLTLIMVHGSSKICSQSNKNEISLDPGFLTRSAPESGNSENLLKTPRCFLSVSADDFEYFSGPAGHGVIGNHS